MATRQTSIKILLRVFAGAISILVGTSTLAANPEDLNKAAGCHKKAKDFDQAIADCTVIIEQGVASARLSDAYDVRGVMYWKKKDLDHASSDLSKAVELDPENDKAQNNLGLVYQKRGELDKASAHYTRSIELYPSAPAFSGRAYVYYQQGDYDRAIADFTRAIELDPDRWDYYVNRGIAISLKGQRADLHEAGKEALATEVRRKAMADLTRSIELHPDRRNADKAYFERGYADWYFGRNFQRADFDRVLADYSKAIAINPEDKEYYKYRAHIYDMLNNWSRAIADARRVIELAPSSRDAAKARENIRRYQAKLDERSSESHGTEGTYIHDCPGGSSIVVRKGYMWHNTPNGGCITYPRDGTWHNCKDGSSVAVPRGWKVYQERDGGCFSYSP